MSQPKTCQTCQQEFERTGTYQIYCSPTCSPTKSVYDGRRKTKRNLYGLCLACGKRARTKATTRCYTCLGKGQEASWRCQGLVGATVEGYDILFRQQQGLCRLCAKPEPTQRRLSWDHDHLTGKPRSLICSVCNIRLGFFETTSIEWIECMRQYLRAFNCQSVLDKCKPVEVSGGEKVDPMTGEVVE